MANWGGLNNALTAWRNAYVALFAKYGIHRGTESDGARADAAHVAGGVSQHIEDSDHTVDANDMDVNVLGSNDPTGTAAERRVIEAMKLDFENDPHNRPQLWIHLREIANKDVRDWAERGYSGKNPHDKHVHWESDQDHEDDGRAWPMPRTEAVLRELLGEDDDGMAAITQARFNELMNGWAATDEGKAALKGAAVLALETKLKWPAGLERIGERSSNLSAWGAICYVYEAMNVGRPADLDGDTVADEDSTVPSMLRELLRRTPLAAPGTPSV